MENKKKCHGGLKVLLLLLFTMLLGTCSISYASMSEGYLDYIITTLHDNYRHSNSTALANFKSYLNQITPAQKAVLLNKINEYMEQQGISNLQDRNIFCTASIPTLKFFITNNGAPGSTNNIDFYCISWGYIKKYTTATNDYIYQINVNVSTPETISTFRFPNQTTLSGIDIDSSNSTVSSDGTVISSYNIATCGIPAGFQTVPLTNYSSNTTKACILQDINGGYVEPQPEPEPEPSGDINTNNTGTITNNSGDTTGKIDLSGIEQGIGNIQNQISGDTQKLIENQNQNIETIVNTISGDVGKITNTLTDNADNIIDNTKITSGDIANTVDFSIIDNNQNYNAYTNFWYNLTTGFSNSMTNIVRTLPIEFRNQNYLINLDEFTVFIPDVLKVFLGIISSVFVCLYITRESKHIVEDIQTASIDNVANKLTEDFETNMF